MRDERGSVTVLTAAVAVCLLLAAALTIDVGALYGEKSRLQAVADAAALAGASALPDSAAARDRALDYAARNGVPAEAVSVEVNADRTRVDVAVQVTARTQLAGAVGMPAFPVRAASAAFKSRPGAVEGAQPLGVELQQFELGKEYRLKIGSSGKGEEGPYRGNFHALALGGSGADTYEENLRHGYPGWLEAGQSVPTEPGNMVGPTADGLRERLEADPYSTWDHPRANSPRVLLVPVILSFEGSGRTSVTIAGFATFFLESVTGGEVRGRFIKWTVPGRPASGEVPDYGTAVIQLVD